MNEPLDNQAQADPARPADPALNPDLVGYQTPEQLAQAHRNLMADAKRRSEENAALKAQIQAAYQPPDNPRQEVRQRGARPSDRLAEFGVPVDAINELLDERIQQAFAPIAAGLTARNTLLSQYPEYTKFESDVASFLNADPTLNQTYQRMFQADPAGAFEYAFLKFGESRRRGSAPMGDLTAEAAAHAAIPSARNGEGRRTQENASGDVQRAWEAYQRAPTSTNARNYAKARLHGVISDDFLRG